MRFKLFEQYDDGDDDERELTIQNIVSEIDKYIGHNEDPYDIASYYYDTVENIDNNGGDVYRLVFLNDIEELNINNLGESWSIDKVHFENFAHSLHRNFVLDTEDKDERLKRMSMTPYLITATLDPNKIDWEKSIDIFSYMYYYEYEVILNSNPIDIDYDEYERTWDNSEIEE